MKWKRIKYLEKYCYDCVILFLEKNEWISYDEIFYFFNTKEELEKHQISYIIIENLKIIHFTFYKENIYFLYKNLFSLLKKENEVFMGIYK